MSNVDLHKPSNMTPALRDLLLGDSRLEAFFERIDPKVLSSVFTMLKEDVYQSNDQRAALLSNSWRLYDWQKAPTPEEFLTPAWLGPFALEMHPHVRKVFLDFWDPLNKKSNLILASAIGTFKSSISILVNLYISVLIWSKRNPKLFYGATAMTSFVQAFISFSEIKAKQVLFSPFVTLLQSSPKFRRIKMADHLEARQKEDPSRVCWTTSSTIGALQFYGDIHYPIASTPANLLGLNMVSATMSEISFFIERGFSPEYISRLYQDAKNRVANRFGGTRIATVILDSSPNDLEFSPIDKYIFTGEAAKDPKNYIVTGAGWEIRPEKDNYKRWRETGETFPVFKGNASAPPEILLTEEAVARHNPLDIIRVPIDLMQEFRENLTKSVKDEAGWPAGNPDKLIREQSFIERMFKPSLRNIYSYVHAPADRDPIHQLWDIVKDRFFIKTGEGRWEFYRAPRAVRFLHADQAETKDHAGIVMSHAEWDLQTSQIIIVHDFTIDIAPTAARISLEAIQHFPEDLIRLGHINMGLVTFDGHQSSLEIGYLKRMGIPVERASADIDPGVYLNYVALINTARIKAGRNIGLKGNLRSLHETTTPSGKKKIDHTMGPVIKDDGGNWNTSIMGVNAKDIADACAVSAIKCLRATRGVPQYTWSDTDDLDYPETELAFRGKPGATSTLSVDLVSLPLPEKPRKSVDDIKKGFIADTLKRYGLSVLD